MDEKTYEFSPSFNILTLIKLFIISRKSFPELFLTERPRRMMTRGGFNLPRDPRREFEGGGLRGNEESSINISDCSQAYSHHFTYIS